MADTVAFIISPDSIASPVCAWEVERVAEKNKRLAPLVWRDVDNDQMPGEITKLNYILFNDPDTHDQALENLIIALDLDIDWIREHTRLGALAQRWTKGSTLLRGRDLEAAGRRRNPERHLQPVRGQSERQDPPVRRDGAGTPIY